MRLVGLLVVAGILLTAARLAVMALFLTMLIVVVVGVMRKPAETLSLLGVLILGGLLQTHATETVGAFLVLCLAGMLLKRIQRV